MAYSRLLSAFCLLCALCFISATHAELKLPTIDNPAFRHDGGPVIHIDGGHHNRHKLTSRYRALGRLLSLDGYRVSAINRTFTPTALENTDILVIANALPNISSKDWTSTTPSAFSVKEIEAIKRWVKSGGSLLLIADHLPWATAAQQLAAAFDVRIINGYALGRKTWPPASITNFRKNNGTLSEHVITSGRSSNEKINQVTTFLGSALHASDPFKPILIFPKEAIAYLPLRVEIIKHINAWPSVGIGGWSQGAAAKIGNGRVAIFAEALMFTRPEISLGNQKGGLGSPLAKQNPQFILNLFRWLAGTLN